jgi:hypothetical protein
MRKEEFNAIGQELFAHLEGFAVADELVFQVPIKYALRGYCFERSSDKYSFYFWAFVFPLCAPSNHLSLSLGDRLKIAGSMSADSRSPTMIEDIRRAMQNQGRRYFLFPDDPQGIAEYILQTMRGVPNPHAIEAAAYLFARDGQLEHANRLLSSLERHIHARVEWQRELGARAQRIAQMLRDDPSAAIRQLDEWRMYTLRQLKLEAFAASCADLRMKNHS